ncbi:MAG: PAS domain S-box protein [Mariprofundaceae bacterium]
MKRLQWLGAALAVGWWPLEAVIHAWLFGEGAFLDRLFAPDVNELWMRLVISTLFFAFGVVAQRMLDRVHAAEARLRRKRDRLGRILDAAYDAWVAMDDAGRITGWNRSAERMFGLPAPKALGSDLAETIVPPDLRGRHRKGLARYRESGIGPWLYKPVRTRAMRDDGTEFPVEMVITPLRGETGLEYFAFIRALERPDGQGASAR